MSWKFWRWGREIEGLRKRADGMTEWMEARTTRQYRLGKDVEALRAELPPETARVIQSIDNDAVKMAAEIRDLRDGLGRLREKVVEFLPKPPPEDVR